MSKVLSIISLIFTIICIVITSATLIFTSHIYKSYKTTINDLETKTLKLESDLLDIKLLNEEIDDSTGSYDKSYFIKIKAKNIEVLSQNNKIVLWIGSSYCSHCAQYAPVITTVGKTYQIPIYYIDIFSIYGSSGIKDQEAYDIMVNLKTDEENKNIMEKFSSTPMTLIIENNTIVGSHVGSMNITNLSEFLKQEGII